MEFKCTCGEIVKSLCLISEFDGVYAYHCGSCNNLFTVSGDEEVSRICNTKDDRSKLEIPNFQLGDRVMLVDTKHKFFLQTGMVIKLSHKFIRIRFDDKEHTVIWMPALVIARM